MTTLLVVIFIFVLFFGFVVFFGAPYLPTMRTQQETALDLMNLKTGQTFYDLGCGDGRMLRAAAARGLVAIGYELNPVLVVVAWLNTLRYRKHIKIRFGNFWKADIKNADGIFVFLIDNKMSRLDRFLQSHCKKPLKLASYAFQIPGKTEDAKRAGVYLYSYRPLARKR
jgi:SAM-dependent methyltransferase